MMAQPARIIFPIDHPLAARISVPGSKSHTNRALLLASLAQGPTRLEQALFSDDSIYFAHALTELGFEVHTDPRQSTVTVQGLGGRIPSSQADLFIGNAGTAARFLTAMLTLGHGRYRLDGVARMRQRPIGDLVFALNNLGARVAATPGLPQSGSHAPASSLDAPLEDLRSLYPPVTVHAAGLPGGTTTIRGDTSSQFLSALLMVAPQALRPVEITINGPLHSRPYIDLTLDVMADFGVSVERQGYQAFHLVPQAYESPGKYWIEGDASSASYFFAAPAICGGWVAVENLSNASRQGDLAFVDILARMGCNLSESGDGLRVAGSRSLHGVEVDMADISDTAMTLAAVAPFAATPTTIRNIASSRLKETDRIAATCAELRRLGVRVDEYPDGMKIYPCDHFQPAAIRTYDDHRIAMAFSLIGLRVPGIEIENPACVAKTFPHFFEVLESLR